ncbi:hypothetical protein KFK09_001422 [Dendrobium nobile]|uniref:Uncharacterized protein n=1 Tax=Dendrobium nobile TaxID=94219 RepID=A0A8T3C9J2_DENNO|nr:hypothetical protein KFK09_001422 [Dendrobium nobile]
MQRHFLVVANCVAVSKAPSERSRRRSSQKPHIRTGFARSEVQWLGRGIPQKSHQTGKK